MGKLFGTDGVRGITNREPMTPHTIVKLGLAIAALLRSNQGNDKKAVLIGKDTRLSSDMVESALTAGLCAGGVDVFQAGILPTPAVSYLTLRQRLAAGVVISASHNHFEDNGIKMFAADGRKASLEDEQTIEEMALRDDIGLLVSPDRVGIERSFAEEAAAAYIKFAAASYPTKKKGASARIVLDCANGATSLIAPRVFSSLGFEVIVVHNTPNGKNINDACGSQHTASLSKKVLRVGALCGFAFDGDGDRVIAVDEKGKALTGDQILMVCGAWLKKKKKLKNNIIVRTVMSNQGMTNALREMGIDFIITDVGDKYVAEAMEKSGAIIGGEDSGHIIFSDMLPTGDGILTALCLLAVVIGEGIPLSRLAKIMEVLPQVLLNVQTKTRRDFMAVPAVARAMEEAQLELGKTGRLLVRYSGTQNLCRVMVESPLALQARKVCERVAAVIEKELA